MCIPSSTGVPHKHRAFSTVWLWCTSLVGMLTFAGHYNSSVLQNPNHLTLIRYTSTGVTSCNRCKWERIHSLTMLWMVWVAEKTVTTNVLQVTRLQQRLITSFTMGKNCCHIYRMGKHNKVLGTYTLSVYNVLAASQDSTHQYIPSVDTGWTEEMISDGLWYWPCTFLFVVLS